MTGHQIVGTCINCGPWGDSLLLSMTLTVFGIWAAVMFERRKNRKATGGSQVAGR